MLLDESQMVRSCTVKLPDRLYDIQLLKSPYSETVDLWPLQLFSNPNHESNSTLFGEEQIREKLKLYLSFNKIEESWTPEVND